MSDYQTDWLDEIEQRYPQADGAWRIVDQDIARLISEVRRYRDEENPNQAAIYWRTIQTQRQMIKNQASTIERMQDALKEINRAGCEKSTYRRCFDMPRLTRDAAYWSEKWCDACVAADALGRES